MPKPHINRPKAQVATARMRERFERWWTLRIALVAVSSVPLFVSTAGYDSFRVPKELLFRAAGIAIAAVMLIAAVWDSSATLRKMDYRRPADALTTLIVGWTLLTSLLSTNRLLSAFTIVWVLSAVLLFLAAERAVRDSPPLIILFGIVPALINAVLAMLQESRIWNPFFSADTLYGPGRIRLSSHWGTVGLLGNSNDVGTYLLAPFVCAMAATIAWRRNRAMWTAFATLLLGGIFVSESLASIIAAAAAIASFLVLLPRRHAISATMLLIVAVVASALVPSPLQRRYGQIVQFARSGQYDRLVSGRLISALSAWEMFKDHPLFGVGPGAYGFQYFEYRQDALQAYSTIFRSGAESGNFGEAHNDHFQILATTGFPGYALMASGILLLASRSLVRPFPTDDRGRFAQAAALPLATVFTVSALAQFPLELAAAVSAYLFFGALCLAWSRGREAL